MFEYALNFELDAINLHLDRDQPNQTTLHAYFVNAVEYANACGRTQKAHNLSERAKQYE